jgi:hypothetical protein
MAQTKDKKKPLTKAAPAKDKKKHGAALSDDDLKHVAGGVGLGGAGIVTSDKVIKGWIEI